MPQSKGYEEFRETRAEIADGMRNVVHEQTTWGEEFQWDNCPIIGTNLAIITAPPSKDELAYLQEWKDKNTYRAIATTITEDLPFDFDSSIVFLRREATKDRAPFLPNYTIRHFSFDNRDLRIDSRRMTSSLSHIIGSAKEEVQEIERYIGGTLHMLKGKIWVLEDHQDNIIASVLYGSKRPDDYWNMDVFGIVPEYSSSDLLEQLIKFSFEGYQDQPLYHFTRKNSPEYKFLKSFNFKEFGNLRITS